MFDLHCHILPGVDDGADNISETVEMCVIAARGGTKGIVATPHCNIPGIYTNYWSSSLCDLITTVRAELKKKNIPVQLFAGQEVFLTDNITSKIKDRSLISINNSRYILCETDFEEQSSAVYRRLEKVREEGLVPIFAHPERYRFFQRDPDAAQIIKDIGCLLQVNKGSLKGRHGHSAKAAAERLLEKRMADFVASDGHSPYSRTPFLEDAYDIICEKYSPEYADYLLTDNPKRVLANETIEAYN